MSQCWLFPGQGTQRRGMGADVFPLYPGLVAKADDVLGYSIEELCLEDSSNLLGTTEFCQPAIYVVNALMFLARKRYESWPSYLAGHSLGEYSALFAAGAFDFVTGLEMVKARAQCMATAGTGSMLAVIGLDVGELLELVTELGLTGLDVANYNLPTQTVMSGPENEIATLESEITDRGLGRAVHLHVGGAFHARYAQGAADLFKEKLSGFDIFDPVIPTVSSMTARLYESGTVRTLLESQILSPVLWVETMAYLRGRGVKSALQIGPGRVLDGLWERFEPTNITSINVRNGEAAL